MPPNAARDLSPTSAILPAAPPMMIAVWPSRLRVWPGIGCTTFETAPSAARVADAFLTVVLNAGDAKVPSGECTTTMSAFDELPPKLS